jgi:hypothetical protein
VKLHKLLAICFCVLLTNCNINKKLEFYRGLRSFSILLTIVGSVFYIREYDEYTHKINEINILHNTKKNTNEKWENIENSIEGNDARKAFSKNTVWPLIAIFQLMPVLLYTGFSQNRSY